MTDPQQMQQMLAAYKAMFPGGMPNPQMQGLNAAQQSLGTGAPAGTNRGAGVVNGAAQLIIALMKAQKLKQLQQQTQQPAVPTPTQGVTPASPVDNSSAPTGMMGPP